VQIMNASILFCGLDVHRNGLSYAAVVDQMGKNSSSRKKVPDSVLLNFFLERYHLTQQRSPWMEASTAIAPVYRELTRQGYDVVISHPMKTRLIAESGEDKKTDRVDSKVLAELLGKDWMFSPSPIFFVYAR
jgi:hypothetical protein